jgi:hypothetical protein
MPAEHLCAVARPVRSQAVEPLCRATMLLGTSSMRDLPVRDVPDEDVLKREL